MKKNVLTILTTIVLTIACSFNSNAQHSFGIGVAAGPAFRTGYTHVVTFGAEYKYLILNEHLGLGAKIGLVNIGLETFVSAFAQALGGSSEKGVTAFLGAASFDYFILTNRWKPYVSFDIGGVASDKNKDYQLNGALASPGIGTRFAITDKFDLDAAFRFPVFINSSSREGSDNVLAGMTVGLGAHFNF